MTDEKTPRAVFGFDKFDLELIREGLEAQGLRYNQLKMDKSIQMARNTRILGRIREAISKMEAD